LDESGINNNDEYPYAWGPKNKRIYGLKLGRRTQRVSIIGALNRRKIIAPFVFEGHCDTEVFCTYLKKVLVKELKPSQTVIMDNASFHKNPNVNKILKRAKCNILYLPSYSPDLNPIEKRWFKVKSKIKKHLSDTNGDLYKCTEIIFRKR
jgi:putative transposase